MPNWPEAFTVKELQDIKLSLLVTATQQGTRCFWATFQQNMLRRDLTHIISAEEDVLSGVALLQKTNTSNMT